MLDSRTFTLNISIRIYWQIIDNNKLKVNKRNIYYKK